MGINLTLLVGEEGKKIILPDREIVYLGRDQKDPRIKDQGVFIYHPEVSRVHCQINHFENKYSVLDLGSRNGTYVNGHIITAETPIKNDDTLNLGKALRFLVGITEGDEKDLQQNFYERLLRFMHLRGN